MSTTLDPNDLQPMFDFEALEQETPAQESSDVAEVAGRKIQSVGRGFRLAFNDLGQQRKLRDHQTSQLLENISVDKRQLKLARVLYDSSHPAIKAKNKARAAVNDLFKASTIPYPEQGIRLFPVRGDELEDQVAEVEAFIKSMRDAIAEFDSAVEKLQSSWPSVVAKSREKLGDLFVASDYPSAEQLGDYLRISLEPYSVELPNYFQHVSPEEYQRAVNNMNDKFEDAARMQEDYIVQAFQSSMAQMVSSVSGYNDGKQKRFANSVVTNVFTAIDKFRDSVNRFGILKGTALEDEFEKLHKVMTTGAANADNLPELLRDSQYKREDIVAKVATLSESITRLAENRPRRNIVRD